MIKYIVLLFLSLSVIGCRNEVLPKPEAMLRLDYPTASYKSFLTDCPFDFDYNKLSSIKQNGDCLFQIEYPEMKASIHITYKQVEGNIEKLLKDAQNLTFEHAIKADNIITQPFENDNHKTYGQFYEVEGNAASQSQFYVTDSSKHFVTGALYFYSKPNYDSILPAADYIKKDIRIFMESLRWK